MRRRWWFMGAGLVVVIVAAVALTMALSHHETPTRPKTEVPDSTSIGRFGFPLSSIQVGKGARALAPDGHTPIGYGPSCEEAALAALNYAPTVADRQGDPNAVEATFLLIWQDGDETKQLARSAKEVARQGATKGLTTSTEYPGLYKIESCTPGKSAVVSFIASTRNAYPTQENASVRIFKQSLVFQNDSWLLSHDLPETAPLPGNGQPVSTSNGSQFVKITPAVINQLFTGDQGEALSRDGWVEVKHATD